MAVNPFTFWNRLLSTWQMNAATGERLLRTSTAAETVVKQRSEIIRAAIVSPTTADYGELARMGPEKAVAFAQSFAVLMRACLDMQAAWWRQAEAASRLMTAERVPTSAEIANLWSGGTEMMVGNVRAGARAGREALAPVARTVAGNARRLRHRPAR